MLSHAISHKQTIVVLASFTLPPQRLLDSTSPHLHDTSNCHQNNDNHRHAQLCTSSLRGRTGLEMCQCDMSRAPGRYVFMFLFNHFFTDTLVQNENNLVTHHHHHYHHLYERGSRRIASGAPGMFYSFCSFFTDTLVQNEKNIATHHHHHHQQQQQQQQWWQQRQ